MLALALEDSYGHPDVRLTFTSTSFRMPSRNPNHVPDPAVSVTRLPEVVDAALRYTVIGTPPDVSRFREVIDAEATPASDRHVLRCVMAGHAGDWRAATDEVSNDVPLDPVAHATLQAWCLLQARQPEPAAMRLQSINQRSPYAMYAFLLLGRAHGILTRHEEATKCNKQAVGVQSVW